MSTPAGPIGVENTYILGLLGSKPNVINLIAIVTKIQMNCQ